MTSFFKNLLQGNVSKKQLYLLFGVGMVLYWIFAFIAMSTYSDFSVLKVYMSYLGAPKHNPNGYIFYNIGELLAGLIIMPLFIAMYQKTKKNMKFFAFFCNFLGILGALAFASLAVFYEGFDTLHHIAAFVAFGGFGGACVFYMFYYLIAFFQKKEWSPSFKKIFIVYGPVIVIALLNVILTGNYNFVNLARVEYIYSNDHIWEWAFFIVVLYAVYGLIYLLPSDSTGNQDIGIINQAQ